MNRTFEVMIRQNYYLAAANVLVKYHVTQVLDYLGCIISLQTGAYLIVTPCFDSLDISSSNRIICSTNGLFMLLVR